MKLRIDIVGGPQKGGKFQIGVGEKLVIGRGQQTDARIDDPAISRLHCELAHHGDSIAILDRGSSSGTFIDGKKIESAVIKPGTKIKIGNSLLHIFDADSPSGPSSPTASIKPVAELVGEKVGPYELTEIIGRGNSGIVFKAKDSENNIFAAVKVLSPKFTAGDEEQKRFVRAMKTMLPIRDERIVRLYNAGKKGPYCWAAMEYVEGENLSSLIKRIGIEDMLQWKDVWRVAVDIARALYKADEHKIVHRNVTPKNIIRRKSDGACLLGDLMLAKALEGSLGN